MKANTKTLLIIAGVGAIGLYAFYRYRKGLSIFPGFGTALAGQGTQGSVLPNTSFGGNAPNLPPVPTQTFSEAERLARRNAATGPLSRSQCNIANGCRWIDTQTGPYYGLGVSQTNFTRWLNMSFTFPGDTSPTNDFVKAALGL